MGKTEDITLETKTETKEENKKSMDAEGVALLDRIRRHNDVNIVQHYDRKLLRDLAHAATCFASLCRCVGDWRIEQALGGHIGGTKEKTE
jgi:hypothetical protein